MRLIMFAFTSRIDRTRLISMSLYKTTSSMSKMQKQSRKKKQIPNHSSILDLKREKLSKSTWKSRWEQGWYEEKVACAPAFSTSNPRGYPWIFNLMQFSASSIISYPVSSHCRKRMEARPLQEQERRLVVWASYHLHPKAPRKVHLVQMTSEISFKPRLQPVQHRSSKTPIGFNFNSNQLTKIFFFPLWSVIHSLAFLSLKNSAKKKTFCLRRLIRSEYISHACTCY